MAGYEALYERMIGSHVSEEKQKLSVEETLDVVLPILDALDVVHDEGIVHRDIKPDNVFLTVMSMVNDIVKVLDFGVAKLLDEAPLTMAGAMVGSPAYMPPEQALGGAIDARADLYAVGAVLYQQAFVWDPPANAAGLTVSPGARLQVGG